MIWVEEAWAYLKVIFDDFPGGWVVRNLIVSTPCMVSLGSFYQSFQEDCETSAEFWLQNMESDL
jgi:hypothetical protein